MEFNYNEYQPSPSLRAVIDCYWTLSTTGPRQALSGRHRCLPIGMAELVIHLEDNYAPGLLGDRGRVFPGAFMSGIMKEPVTRRMHGSSGIFGVRFKPEGFLQLFRMPLAELCNNIVDVETFLPKADVPIVERIREGPNYQARIVLVEAFLHHRLARMSPASSYFTEALRQVRSQQAPFTHAALEKKLQVGERQLQRMFKDNLGMSPKSYFRIMRFRRAYDSVMSQKEVDWLDLTHSLGYSDQSHFIRDFKSFAGVTPTALSA